MLPSRVPSCMRLPLVVVTRLAVHNLLMEHGLKVAVTTGLEKGTTSAADVPALVSRILDAHQRRVEQYAQFRRCARGGVLYAS